jgi:uncharacterized membrane protein YsdA (DUF1294 family)/cold shock CspA family protein
MRLNGSIKSWNDERGFGFIVPADGGPDVFVHVTALNDRRFRPAVGKTVSFEVESTPEGKTRARAVAPVNAGTRPRSRKSDGPASWGGASHFAIPAVVLIDLAAATVWRVPGWVAGCLATAYLVASLIAYLAYGIDKAAAASSRRRVPETTLLAIGLLGGWPGAIVAQQTLRHKSVKEPFRSLFWGTVAVNVLLFLFAISPYGRALIAAVMR